MELSNVFALVAILLVGTSAFSVLTAYLVYKMKHMKKTSITTVPGIRVQKNTYQSAEYKSPEKVYTMTMGQSTSTGFQVIPGPARIIDLRYR